MQPRGPHVCCRLSGPYGQRGARQTMAPSCAENDGYEIASGKHRVRTWQVTRTGAVQVQLLHLPAVKGQEEPAGLVSSFTVPLRSECFPAGLSECRVKEGRTLGPGASGPLRFPSSFPPTQNPSSHRETAHLTHPCRGPQRVRLLITLTTLPF